MYDEPYYEIDGWLRFMRAAAPEGFAFIMLSTTSPEPSNGWGDGYDGDDRRAHIQSFLDAIHKHRYLRVWQALGPNRQDQIVRAIDRVMLKAWRSWTCLPFHERCLDRFYLDALRDYYRQLEKHAADLLDYISSANDHA